MLEAACREAVELDARSCSIRRRLAVNVSRVQLVAGNLERVVYDALMRSSLDPRLLELEITESLMIEGENALAPLRDLGAIGLTLALDDFGSGYSTLASLVRFPVHTLKLDRALIRDIDSNPDAARVVRAVIRMAHELGRRVVAEGVDNYRRAALPARSRVRRSAGLPAREADACATSSARCSRPGARRRRWRAGAA